MAVTLTALELAAELRVGDGTTALVEPELGIITRLLAAATAAVLEFAPDAPDAIHNTAAARVAAYLYDTNPADGMRPQDILGNSGAQSLLAGFKVERALALE